MNVSRISVVTLILASQLIRQTCAELDSLVAILPLEQIRKRVVLLPICVHPELSVILGETRLITVSSRCPQQMLFAVSDITQSCVRSKNISSLIATEIIIVLNLESSLVENIQAIILLIDLSRHLLIFVCTIPRAGQLSRLPRLFIRLLLDISYA